MVSMVDAYTRAYSGAYSNGMKDSARPSSELTLPSSSLFTNLVAIDRRAMNEVPLNVSAMGPVKQ